MPASAEPRPGRWEELTKAERFELLAGEHLGRVAVTDDRGPVVFPVNFVLDRHTVVFRTEEGTKLHAAIRGSRVCFEADRTDQAARTGWSVIVRGEITEVTDPAEPGPASGRGPATIGAELELFLVDDAARPLPVNQAVRDLAADPRIALELNRFNLELNASPTLPGARSRRSPASWVSC